MRLLAGGKLSFRSTSSDASFLSWSPLLRLEERLPRCPNQMIEKINQMIYLIILCHVGKGRLTSIIDVVAWNINHATNMQGHNELLSLSQLELSEPNSWKGPEEVAVSKVPTLYLLLTIKTTRPWPKLWKTLNRS